MYFFKEEIHTQATRVQDSRLSFHPERLEKISGLFLSL